MRYIPLILIYTVMCVFDFAVLAGTAWLISERHWSAWWVLVAMLICTGSDPKKLILAWNEVKALKKADIE
jgi:hypothetical protein